MLRCSNLGFEEGRDGLVVVDALDGFGEEGGDAEGLYFGAECHWGAVCANKLFDGGFGKAF
jgi:hypothetical protein